MDANSFSSLLILLLIARVAQSGLVPRLSYDNYKLEPIGDHEYKLDISRPLGAFTREETVKETKPGELEVTGKISQLFPLQSLNEGILSVTYKAGANGYLASYKFRVQQAPEFDSRLGANFYRSAVG